MTSRIACIGVPPERLDPESTLPHGRRENPQRLAGFIAPLLRWEVDLAQPQQRGRALVFGQEKALGSALVEASFGAERGTRCRRAVGQSENGLGGRK